MANPRRRKPRPGGASPAAREEARRLRLTRERDESRRRRVRRLVVAGAVVGALFLFGLLQVFLHRPGGEEKRLLAEAPAAAAAAGCGPVRTIAPYGDGLDRAHIGSDEAPTMPALDTYPSIPPVSGPHAPTPFPAGVYATPPPLDRVVHSLEHASVVIWYDLGIASDELTRIKEFVRTSGEGNHVIVAPYDYPDEGEAGRLPSGTTMVLAAWHHLRTCERPSLAVAFDFIEHYRFNLYRWGSYRGDAPEKFAPI
jgi:hypothetical protein